MNCVEDEETYTIAYTCDIFVKILNILLLCDHCTCVNGTLCMTTCLFTFLVNPSWHGTRGREGVRGREEVTSLHAIVMLLLSSSLLHIDPL